MRINLVALRKKLICENMWEEYEEIFQMFKNPYLFLKDDTTDKLKAIGFDEIALELQKWNKQDLDDYRSVVLFGQAIVWEELYVAYKKLKKVKNTICSMNVVFFDNNYMKSTEQVYYILDNYSKAKTAITELEIHLGVDRYLDKVASSDFDFLMTIFDEIHKKVEDLLEKYKEIYIQKWNTANVYETIIHKLISKKMSNQVCSLLQSNKKRVLLFIIDGFGMGQYLWSKKVVPANGNFSYNTNIFEWLAKNNLSDEFILGSPLVSDTAAGLGQIFIGKTAYETRIISSTVKKEGSNNVVAVKSEPESVFRKIVDCGYSSFTVDIAAQKEQMKIYYCSKYDQNNLSGFSKYIFDSAYVQSVIPPERVYSFLHDDFERNETGATVVYITSIDNSGHVMGSFSQFERYEHEKLNTMVKNFFIDLAKTNSELFDGNTSILFTADHGMTESYRINISRYDIQAVLDTLYEHARIIEANRALFLYGISQNGLQMVKDKLREYFDGKDIDVLILSEGDVLFDEYMPQSKNGYISTTPEIVVLFISEGIFYSKNLGENLMHFGGHGGHSIDEVFVPLVNIELNAKLLESLNSRFLKLN